MTDPALTPISALAPAAALTGAELLPLVQGGVSKRVTAQALADLAGVASGTAQLSVTFAAPAAIAAWSNQPAALAHFHTASQAAVFSRATLIDLASYTECRLTAIVSTAGAAAARLIVRYAGSLVDAGAYLQIGDITDVAVSIAAAGLYSSGWVDLAAGARADNRVIALLGDGGDGVADPAVNLVMLQFR